MSEESGRPARARSPYNFFHVENIEEVRKGTPTLLLVRFMPELIDVLGI